MNTLSPQITIIELAKLFPSPTNPRKKFDAGKLAELSASIERRGIKSPLLVRPVGAKFEIVAGERRFRAGQGSKLEQFPCIIEELSDADVLELQLIENLQREDLDPLDESEHYHRMLELTVETGGARYTVPQLSEKIGKPVGRIYRLLKLRDLPKKMRLALQEGTVGANLASLVARIPTKEMREKAATEILNDLDGPMSQRQALELIHDEYMVELKGAPFALDDESLVPVAFSDPAKTQRRQGGACEDCPLRTGNNRALYGEETRGDICTNPQCYALKREAAWDAAMASAKSDGKKVISEKESQSLFYYGASELAWNSSYFELDKQPAADLVSGPLKGVPTWRKLVEGGPCKVEVCVVRTPRGKILEIADRQQLMEAAKKNGHEKLFEKGVRVASTSKSPAEQKAAKADREKQKLDAALTAAGFTELWRLLEGQDETPPFWGHPPEFQMIMLWNAMDRHAGSDGRKLVCRYLDLKPVNEGYYENHTKPVMEYAKAFANDARKIHALTTMVLLSQGMRWHGIADESFKKIADWLKLDLSALKKRVEQELKDGKKTTPPKRVEAVVPPIKPSKPASKEKAKPKPKAAAVKKGKVKSKVVSAKPDAKTQLGSTTEKILSALKKGGKDGLSPKEIAKSAGLTPQTVSVWIATTGKRTKGVKKEGVGKFRFEG